MGRKHTEQVPHFQLHIFNQSTDVGDMARVRLNGQIGLHLPGHVAAEVHRSQGLCLAGQVQDDRARQFVVRHAGAVRRLEDVDAVPRAGALRAGGDTCRNQRIVSFAETKVFEMIERHGPFFSKTTPANPSSRSQK